MNNQLEQNKLNAIAFYQMMFDGEPEKAIELYVGDEYRQHNPMVEDGKVGVIEYFTRLLFTSLNSIYSVANVLNILYIKISKIANFTTTFSMLVLFIPSEYMSHG